MAPRCAGGENTEYARRRSARECGVPDQSGQREAEKFGSASKARSFRFYCTEERLRTLLGCDVDDKKYLAEFSLSAAHHNQTERDPPSGVSPAQSPPFLAGEKVHSEENSVMVLSSRDQASETEDDAFENLSVGLEAVEFTGVVPASEDDDSSLASGLLEQPSSDEEDYLDPDYLDEQSLLCEGQPSAGSRKRQKAHPDCEFEQDPPSNPSGRELSLGDFRAGTPSTDGASSGDVRDWILSHSPPNFYPSPGAFTADSRDFVGHRARPAEEETRSNGDRCLFQSSVSAVERDNFFSVEFTGDAAGPWRTTKRAPYSRSGFCGSPRPKPTSHMSATRRSASAAAHHGSCLKAFYPFQQFPDVSFGRSTRPKSHSRGLDFPLFSLLFSNDLQKRQSLPTRWPPAVLDPAQWRSRNREPPDGSQKPCEEEETAAGGPRATVPQEAQDGDVSDKLQLAARRQGVKSGSCVSPHRQLGNQKSARQQSERSEQERIFRGRQDGRYAVSRRKGQEPTEDTTENDRVSQFSLQRGATRDKGEVAQNGAEGRTYELYTRRCALCRTEWICGAEQERVSCERSNAVEENDPADIKSHAGYRKGRRTCLSVAQPQSFADWSFTLTMSQRRETPDGAGSVGEESDQKAYQSHPLYGQSPNKEQNSRIGRSKRRPGQLFAAAVRRSPNAPSCRNSKGGIVGGVQERSRSTDSMTEDGKTAELRRQARRAKESEVEQKRTHEKHDLWQRKSITDTVRTASVETEETCGVPRDDTASYNQKLTKKGTEVVVFCAPMSRNQLSDTTTGHSFSGKKGAFCPAAPSRVISYLGSPLVSKTSSRDRWLLLEAKTEIGERRASQLTGCLLRDEDTGKAGGREGQNVGCCEGARTRILATLYRGRERQSEAADLTCGGGPPEIAPSGCVRSETGLQCIGKSGHLRESTEEGGPQTRAAKEIEHDDRGDMRGPKRSGFPCLSERLLVPIRGRQQTSLAERGREGVFERGAEAYVGSESRPAKRLQEQLARKTGVQVVTGCEKKGQLANSLHSPDERIESSSSPGGRMVQLRQHRKKGEGAVVSESQGREEGPPCLLGCKNEAWDRERKTHAQKGTRDHVNPQHEAQRTHAQEGEGLKQRRTLQQKLLREVTAAQASCSEAPLKWRQPEQEKNVTHSVKNTTYIHSEKHPRHTIQKKREKALKKITPDHVENRAEKEKELHRPGETGTHWRAEGENPGVESSANEHEAFEQFSSPSSAGLVGSARPLAKGGMAVSQTRGHLDATCRRKRYARRRQGTAFQSRGIHSCVGTESTEDCQPVMPPSSLARSGIFRRISRTSFRASRRDPVVTGIMATSVPEGLTSGKGTGAWLSVWHWTVWSAMIVLQWSWWRVNAVSI